MKVKDLIKELEKSDPEAEVVVDGYAVGCMGLLPGYYDGYYDQAIIENNYVIGIKHTRGGYKFKLTKIDVFDAVYDDPDNFLVEWDDDGYFSDKERNAMQLKYDAVRWIGRQHDLKWDKRSALCQWFPINSYELAENPLKQHLPDDWD